MQKRLAGIDILRGSAALAVVLAHLHKWHVDLCHGSLAGLCGWLGRVCTAMGSWGVGLFFVLSGVCIHLPAARAANTDRPLTFSLKSYAARRFWRIYPPHLGALLLSWGAAAVVSSPPAFDPMISTPTAGQLIAHLFMVHTFVPGAMYSINVVLWTIAIEAHFYVLYPVLLKLRQRFSLVSVTATLFVGSLGLRLLAGTFKGHPIFGMLAENFPGRWWEWTLGAVIAELATDPRRRRIDLSNTFLGVLTATSLLLTTLVESLPHGILVRSIIGPFIYATVVLAAMKVSSAAGQGMLVRGTLWLGHRSYSLYLIHPIMLTFAILVLGPMHQMAVSLRVGLALASAIAGSALYFALVERRFLAGRSPFISARPASPRPRSSLPGL